MDNGTRGTRRRMKLKERRKKVQEIEELYQKTKTPYDDFIKHLIKIISQTKAEIEWHKAAIEKQQNNLEFYYNELDNAKIKAVNYIDKVITK